jgi:hypothetical protein
VFQIYGIFLEVKVITNMQKQWLLKICSVFTVEQPLNKRDYFFIFFTTFFSGQTDAFRSGIFVQRVQQGSASILNSRKYLFVTNTKETDKII